MHQEILLKQKLKNPYFRNYSKEQLNLYITLLIKLRESVNNQIDANSFESYFKTTDGVKIFYQVWLPSLPMKKIVIMCHGFQCHSDLYYVLGDYFHDKNILIAAWDQRGHGRTIGFRGYLKSFSLVYNDLLQFIHLLKQKYPNIPVYLMGESMGALVVLNFAVRYPSELDGLIVLAPGLRLKILKSLKPLTPLAFLLKFFPLKKPVIKIPSDFDNPSYEAAFNEFDMNDLLHLNPVSISLLANLINLVGTTLSNIKVKIQKPILICQGTGDKMLNFIGAKDLFDQINFPDKTLKFYKGANHSLLMDQNSKKIYQNIYEWLKLH